MCENCVELNKKIEHYQQLSAGIDDRSMNDMLAALIDELQEQKAARHPELRGEQVATAVETVSSPLSQRSGVDSGPVSLPKTIR
jgi:hypothetical protein